MPNLWYSNMFKKKKKSRSASAATDRAEARLRGAPLAQIQGGDGECQTASAQERLTGATPRPRSGEAAERSNPQVQGAAAARAQEGRGKLLHDQSQRGGCEEIPLIQRKEQRLCFTGAALKNPCPR